MFRHGYNGSTGMRPWAYQRAARSRVHTRSLRRHSSGQVAVHAAYRYRNAIVPCERLAIVAPRTVDQLARLPLIEDIPDFLFTLHLYIRCIFL